MSEVRFSEEQMKAFSMDAIPVLEQLFEIARKNGVIGSIRVYSSGDGYVSLEGEGLPGWELRKYNGEYEMSYKMVVGLEVGATVSNIDR